MLGKRGTVAAREKEEEWMLGERGCGCYGKEGQWVSGKRGIVGATEKKLRAVRVTTKINETKSVQLIETI